jgi:hypothetical protein
MTRNALAILRSARPLALFVVGSAAFAAAYGLAPLYYSNQNQYFLHGLADAGQGLLREDWLANTRDPTPVFSALVANTIRHLHPWAFHLYHALLLGAYAAALLGLFAAVVGHQTAARRWPVFIALLVAVHSALARWCSYRWLGNDYPWFLQAGVAGQYVLGSMFQPSVFGVLLVVAVCLFVRDRPFLAVACAALAATAHPTYLLPAALLTLGFLVALGADGQGPRAMGVGALALALVLPVTVYMARTFGPTSAETFAEAEDILVNVRIPHHTRPDLWLDPVAGLQVAWVVLGLALVWGTRLFPVLAVPFLLGVLLTLVQVATGSHTLALLFPWRVSSVLVPVATAVVLSRLAGALPSAVDGPVVRTACALAVAVFVAGGVWISVGGRAFLTSDEDLALMDFVRQSRKPGDVYFLPVNVPDLAATTRGSLSSDFKPLAEKKRDGRIIPVDLQRFRLYTGAPIFVDFKSVPYQDTEVLEWYARLHLAQRAQKQIRKERLSALVVGSAVLGLMQPDGQPGNALGSVAAAETMTKARLSQALAELRRQVPPRRRITHLVLPVLPAGRDLEGDGIAKVHEDAYYQVYHLTAAPEGR